MSDERESGGSASTATQSRPMRVLTVQQPWAELIAAGIKDVENRSWATSYRGPLAILAGRQPDRSGPPMDPEPVRGAIVAVVDLIACERGYDSTWAQRGRCHWVLANPRRVEPPLVSRGTLGLRALDATTEAEILSRI